MNYVLGLLAGVLLLIGGLIWLNESQANKIKAEAQAQMMIMREQSNARLTSAQASAVTMVAALPIIIVICGGMVGVILAAALLVWIITHRPARQEVKLIERQVVFMLPPGGTRWDMWRQLEQNAAAETHHRNNSLQ